MPAADEREFVQRALREHAGARVLVVGHGDTIPEIVADLRGSGDSTPITDIDYGTIYIVTVPRLGRANLLRLKY